MNYSPNMATSTPTAGESTQESPAIGEGNQDTEYGGQGKQEGESMDEDDQERYERGAAEDAVEQPYRVSDDNDCNAEPERHNNQRYC